MDSLIFDTSVLINVGGRGNLTHLLERLAEHYVLVVPAQVAAETIDALSREVAEKYFDKVDIRTTPTDVRMLAKISADLDEAEIAVIALARSRKCRAVIDERAARRVARELGVPVIGTLGLFSEAIGRGWISDDEALEYIRKLRAKGFRCPQIQVHDTFLSYFERIR